LMSLSKSTSAARAIEGHSDRATAMATKRFTSLLRPERACGIQEDLRTSAHYVQVPEGMPTITPALTGDRKPRRALVTQRANDQSDNGARDQAERYDKANIFPFVGRHTHCHGQGVTVKVTQPARYALASDRDRGRSGLSAVNLQQSGFGW
jgi:hypothetical protein